MTNSSRIPNRLIHEKSPYLLQHAHNPVDWYPWGKEAFEKARREDKPIFLSVGYSACHWCHVMERESFEDDAVGELLNRHFVPIKVDREERPDVDAVSMAACLALTGGGGWPTTVLMTPDRRPFFAGTYLPKTGAGGEMGLIELLRQAASLWEIDRDRLLDSGRRIAEHLRRTTAPTPAPLDESAAGRAFEELSRSFDARWGGFGGPPKFPSPHHLMFLLRYGRATGDERALPMVEKTLDAMARGGLFDHVGGGFARYATDRRWLVPHFEKMLYDNALLGLAYSEAFAFTGRTAYREVAERVFEFALTDMADPGGAFYSAWDADSEGGEGKYYVWAYRELRDALSPSELALLNRYYPVTPEGNFKGMNVINRIGAPDLPVSGTPEREAIDAVLRRLRGLRAQRIPPARDDKILSGWNGLMIAALAAGGRMLGDERYTQAARRAAAFVWDLMADGEGRLRTRFRDGETSPEGFLDDAAYFAWGLLELFATTFDPAYLARAVRITDAMIRDFGDEGAGGFFLSPAGDESLPLRPRSAQDGALPSGNAVAAMNLTRLWALTGEPRWRRTAGAVFEAFGGNALQSPLSHTHMLSALLTAETPGAQLVLAGRPGDRRAAEALRAAGRRFLPFAAVLSWDGNPELASLIPSLSAYPWDGEPAAYVCRGFACGQPTRDLMGAVASLV